MGWELGAFALVVYKCDPFRNQDPNNRRGSKEAAWSVTGGRVSRIAVHPMANCIGDIQWAQGHHGLAGHPH
jgi:hypothetical protein